MSYDGPKPKISPIRNESIDIWGGGYRGEWELQWKVGGYDSAGILQEVFAARCKCGLWWGWTPYIGHIRDVLRRFRERGCPACK